MVVQENVKVSPLVRLDVALGALADHPAVPERGGGRPEERGLLQDRTGRADGVGPLHGQDGGEVEEDARLRPDAAHQAPGLASQPNAHGMLTPTV